MEVAVVLVKQDKAVVLPLFLVEVVQEQDHQLGHGCQQVLELVDTLQVVVEDQVIHLIQPLKVPVLLMELEVLLALSGQTMVRQVMHTQVAAVAVPVHQVQVNHMTPLVVLVAVVLSLLHTTHKNDIIEKILLI
jgi:ACR3 family arsenite efflux pump ArsB